MKKENKEIVGVSFLIDNETQNLIKELNFNEDEMKNLSKLMHNYNDEVEILKIIKLDGFTEIKMPNYDCCILQVNEKTIRAQIAIGVET